MNNTNNIPNNAIVYSNPNMTPEQFDVFQKECLWNDGYWSGKAAGKKESALVGFIYGGIFALGAMAYVWWKTRKTNNQNEKEGD